MVLVAIWETRDRQRAIRDGTDIGYAEAKAIGKVIGIAEGIAIGYAEANTAWRSWLHRKDSAAANGLPFDEPMPTRASIRASIRARHPNPPPSHPA